MGQSLYNTVDADESTRKALNPSKWISYLPKDSPFTTLSLSTNTPTKVKVPTQTKSVQDFGIFDKGGGDLAVQYQGTVARPFKMNMVTGIETSASNVEIVLSVYKYQPGTTPVDDTYEVEGTRATQKLGPAGDKKEYPIIGFETLQPNDLIEIWVEIIAGSGTVTFKDTSIIIEESN